MRRFLRRVQKRTLTGSWGIIGKASRPSVRLKVKVVLGSSRDKIAGWLGDALKIKVMAPPEEGRANEAVVEMLAETVKTKKKRNLTNALGSVHVGRKIRCQQGHVGLSPSYRSRLKTSWLPSCARFEESF